MKKLQELIEKYGLPLADKLQNNSYFSAITEGFSMILPIIMMGAIFTLLSSLQIAPYQAFVEATGLKTIFGYAGKYTSDLIGLFTVFAIGYQLTRKLGYETHSGVVGTISIVMFLVLIPIGVSGKTDGGEIVNISSAISTGYLGSKAVISSIIVGLIVPTIYTFFIKRNVVIKMPASVPPTIAKSFSALIPGFVILFLFSLVTYAFSFTGYGDFNTWIYAMLEAPLSILTSSPLSFIVLILICQLLWCAGIHGYMVIRPILQVVYLPLAVENLAAYGAGQAMPHVINYYNWGTFVSIGGVGGVLGLTLLMSFFAKSERFKKLGKISLPSVLCNINEPILFGTPIVLNPVMMIPFVITPIVTFLLSYLMQIFGIIPYLAGVSLPLGTPVLLYGWLQGGLPIMITQLLLIVVQILIYLPFFKVADKQAVLEEQAILEEEVTVQEKTVKA